MSEMHDVTMAGSSTDRLPPHPFHPIGVEIVGYVANSRSTATLLGIFLAGWIVILGLTWASISRFWPSLRNRDKYAILWFILSGAIHLFFEGYFSLNHTQMAPAQDLFGELWKEYALADSRYLTSDPFVLCMESVTAFLWGPLCFYTAFLITVNHPLRFSMQAVVSLGQMYGDVLYYATSMFDHYHKDLTYCRPEAYYFWFYFFFMNFIWMVIPGALLLQSIRESSNAFSALHKRSNIPRANGAVSKPSGSGYLKQA